MGSQGGKREGAGRPQGSKNVRTVAVMEYLDPDRNNPVVKLVNIMNKAYRSKDLRLAADCAKALLPYYIARQKIMEDEDDHVSAPIQVNVNFPLPGSGWRKTAENDGIIYDSKNDADLDHSD